MARNLNAVIPGKKEITPTHDGNKIRQASDCLVHRRALDSEYVIPLVITQKGILILIEAIERSVVDPGLLNEFELPPDIRVDCYKESPWPSGPVVLPSNSNSGS